MELIIKQLKKGAKHTRLSVTEKSDMKNVLLRHVKSNPVSNEVLARHQKTKAHAILSPLQVNNLRNKKTMPILVILGLLMSGSASFAAETTVPGDMLYPVKVHVNESVRGAVTVTPSAKAEWELHLVERRLEEVEKLATRPNAAPQAQEQAQENLVKYTKHVEDRIAKFEEDEDGEHALKTASDLSGVLSAYEALLAALAAGQGTTSGTVASSTATSTPATTASSTATSTVSNATASSTPATTLTPASIAALREILSKLNQAQNGAEEKHNELKKKYNKEEKNDNDDEDGEDEGDHDDWTPAPVVPPVATTTPSTSTSTATTTPTTVATSTAVIASSTQRVRIEKHDDDNHREEIRTTSTSTTSTTTPRVSRERTESRESHNDND